ncbi:MAG: hypothetical protein QNJ12_18480 [Ilumatobacter sp.]|uniref:hypothetical protein n=1 Tax=Ilumatobacter sp. TaxID=1967498 RepID=UPI00260A168A|nr:hypothetical protein [Ilumatobacter sp.]MDJ0770787.1 hypothetical protein [Ilumatobacter sp.]
MPTTQPSLADHVCLAIIGEGRTHGWALVKLLAPDGELGRIWSLSRALTYRSVDHLVELGLATRDAAERRAELAITPAGRRRRRAWLGAPVDHLRDLRTEFLVKVALRERSGLDVDELFEVQLERLRPAIEALTASDEPDHVGRWRRESALAALRFLERS